MYFSSYLYSCLVHTYTLIYEGVKPMKFLTKKELISALSLGLLGAILLSAPVVYALHLFNLSLKPPFSLQREVENIISIPIILAEKRLEEQALNQHTIPVRVSFYTGLAIENGGYAKMNAIGGPLIVGSLAAPKDIPFGTIFMIENLPSDVKTSTFVVDDRGNAIVWLNDTLMKVDVYVERKAGEDDLAYFNRVNNLGVIYTYAIYQLPN